MGFGGCDDNPDCHCVVIWVVMVLGVVVRREVARGTLDIGGRWSPVRGLFFGDLNMFCGVVFVCPGLFNGLFDEFVEGGACGEFFPSENVVAAL